MAEFLLATSDIEEIFWAVILKVRSVDKPTDIYIKNDHNLFSRCTAKVH